MQIIKGKTPKPPRITLYGPEKIGKTATAAQADRPIFIQTEEGADDVGVDRFPLATSLADVQTAISAIDPVAYGTVVIDSLDWLERLIHDDVAKTAGVRDIESIGYGKGYAQAVSYWRDILGALDSLRAQGMAIVLIAHSEIKRYDDPSTEPYDRYQLKLHRSASAIVTEWCDALLFACLETKVTSTDAGFNKEVRRGISTGRRVLRTQGAPAWVAGNRYGLPPTIDLSWDALATALSDCMTK